MADHDVIIVGARCAGAALGAMLAKRGMRTLVLDADALPSDMPMSTHYIQPPGMDVLDELGVGDAVRAVTPASTRILVGCEDTRFVVNLPPGRVAYCPRRITVDSLLQGAARRAGAELRDRHRVVGLVRDGERVAGVVVETPEGRVTLRARVVVGADGRKSTIARLTAVEEYLRFEMTRAAYWLYFPMPASWQSASRTWDSFIGWQGDGLRYVFQCDSDLLLCCASPPGDQARTWGQDSRAKTLEYLRGSEVTRSLVDGNEPIGKATGLLKATYFYRRPVGPGFALVGDAGSFKDFVTGHGMTDAFLGARRLAEAIADGSERAFQRYWRQRDAETMPLYFDALRIGHVGFNDPLTAALFEHMARDQRLADRFGLVADRQISPFELLSNGRLLRVVAGAALRGRLDVLPAFLQIGKQMGAYQQEVARRTDLARHHAA